MARIAKTDADKMADMVVGNLDGKISQKEKKLYAQMQAEDTDGIVQLSARAQAYASLDEFHNHEDGIGWRCRVLTAEVDIRNNRLLRLWSYSRTSEPVTWTEIPIDTDTFMNLYNDSVERTKPFVNRLKELALEDCSC